MKRFLNCSSGRQWQMLKVLILATFFVELVFAHGGDSHERALEDRSLQTLMLASSWKKTEMAIREYDELSRMRRACDMQLRLQRSGLSCFEVLNMEKRLGLISRETFEQQMRRLNRLCVLNATQERNLNRLKESLRYTQIPAKCRNAIQARAQDLIYMYETLNPGDLFLLRQTHDSGQKAQAESHTGTALDSPFGTDFEKQAIREQ